MNSEFSQWIKATKDSFDGFFFPFFENLIPRDQQQGLYESILYSLIAGGKRIRPILVLQSSVVNPEQSNFSKDALLLASAVECIHTYSLIHDDLPAMDNDDFRRGMLTNHKKFGESTAILAGDALNSLAFSFISQMETRDAVLVKDCISILHNGAGWQGMVLGQFEDLYASGKPEIWNTKILESIHSKKTGALILSSFLLGNRLLPDYLENQERLTSYAKEIGLLFQITDDILDIEGTKESLGKTPGKDLAATKFTYPSMFGIEEAKRISLETKDRAIELANQMEGFNKKFFLELPEYIAKRKN